MPTKLPDHRSLVEVRRRGAELFQRSFQLARKVRDRHTPVRAKDTDGFCASAKEVHGCTGPLTQVYFWGELRALPTCL
jgi:hypothetical protein